MEKDWTLVFTTSLPYQAEIAKEILANEDIEAVILNKQDSNKFVMLGDIEVYVFNEDAEKAKELLKELGN